MIREEPRNDINRRLLQPFIRYINPAPDKMSELREWEGDVVFLHEVANGTADRSYGIQVAKLAGLPTYVVERAQEVLDILEKREANDVAAGVAQLPLFAERKPAPKPQNNNELQKRLSEINPDELTPRMAIDLLYELKKLSQKYAKR